MLNSKIIKNAVYNLCIEANTTLNDKIFIKILDAYNSEKNTEAKQALQLILKNAKMAYLKKMPLCQDTGQVLVFVKLGNKCQIEGLEEAINKGVSESYTEKFYRKSIVKNAIFNRTNTKTNTPCLIYIEITQGDEIELELLIKGAGSENISVIEMLSPTTSKDEIIKLVTSTIKKAGAKGCPPYFIGVGIGGTMEYAGTLSKKALLLEQNIDDNHKDLAEKIKKSINELEIGVAGFGGNSTTLDVKVLTEFTHIACMPVAITVNCHSSRHAKCLIKNGKIIYYPQKQIKNYSQEQEDFSSFTRIDASNVNAIKSLKQGQNILLSGDIYTARDMAHNKLIEIIDKNQILPFDLKDKILFYTGPCSCPKDCIIGSVGPTTSSRMDKFAIKLYEKGILATIGKGSRSEDVKRTIKRTCGLYFTAIGGIACYLSEKVINRELIAFEYLGTEAIYKLKVKDFPLKVDFK